MAQTSDNESEASFPDVLSREQMTELDSDNLLNDRNNIEKNTIDQRFYEMNRQIGELTDLVLALIQQISSNQREGNGLNMAKPSANGHSDNNYVAVFACNEDKSRFDTILQTASCVLPLLKEKLFDAQSQLDFGEATMKVFNRV